MQQITFHHGKRKIFDGILDTAKQLSIDIIEHDFANGKIELADGGGLLSWGNKIEVHIKSSGSSKNTVHVSSRSAALLQVADWGTNSRIESKLIETLKENLG